MNPNTQTISTHMGQVIKATREHRGLAQTKVAELMGVSYQQYQKYEYGKSKLCAYRLVQLSRIFDVKIETLFKGVKTGGT